MMLQARHMKDMPLGVLAALCLAGAELGHQVAEPGATGWVPVCWPPAGVLAAALISADRKRWPRLVVTACAAILLWMVVLHRHPGLPSLGVSLIAGLDAWLVAWLVRRFVDEPLGLDRLSHMRALIAGAA